jgi:thiamine pyrophosphate-dependent acetolactate synthase large subunit-like protein
MTPRTGGDWVIEALRAEGVRHVFGIPGVHNLPIYNALLRQSAIRHTLARHEQGAAFMADGYARSSGQPGVLIVTTGPGATNTLTALAESYAGSIPVLTIMSDVPLPVLGREVGALHEIVNQIECFKPACRWAETIADGRMIASSIQGAFDLFESSRPGPIALSIPADLLATTTDGRIVAGLRRARPPCHVDEIDEAARLLSRAARPLIIAGGGVVSSSASGELREVARRLGAPVVTTVMGRGTMPDPDPLWHGVLPNGRATEELIKAADVIFAVGCRFAHRSTQGLLLNLAFAPDQTLIHLDVDPTVIGRLFKPQLGIVGDARDGLARLLGFLAAPPRERDWRTERLLGLRTAANARYTAQVETFIQVLRRSLADDAIVVNDQTGINYWMEWRFPVLAPRTFLYPVGTATLGYGIPSAIGAKIANPDRQVVAVVGDGGFMFSVNELATAVKYGLGVVFVVVNDDRFGAIKYLQDRMFGLSGEVDLQNPDFPVLSRAFGAAGERVASLDALGDALGRALARSGPTVLELRMAIDPPWEL